MSVDMFNNIFSHAQVFAVRLDNGSAVPTSFRAGFNNYFANTAGNQRDGLSLGSNNLTADPKFVNRAAGKLNKAAWTIILGLGVVAQIVLAGSPLNLINLAFTFAALVYLADVKPALSSLTRR